MTLLSEPMRFTRNVWQGKTENEPDMILPMEIIKCLLRHTPFFPVHMGQYLREKYFFSHLQELPVASFREVLDAGCGPATYTRKLAMTYPDMKVTGIDIKKFATWDGSPPNVQFEQQDLLRLAEESCYDFCLCIDVLEHIPGNRRVLENIFRSLKPGGYFYLHMPDDRHDRRIFPRKLFNEFDKWAQDEHVGEQYTLEEMKNIFKSIGFAVVEAHNTFGFWGKLAWELDRITDSKRGIKVLLMPLLRVFAHLDALFPKSNGAICVLGQKPLSSKHGTGV